MSMMMVEKMILPIMGKTRRRQVEGVLTVIPTPDADASVTHPSVVDTGPEGWFGFRWWMAVTPWPDGSREYPCLVASNDRRRFVVPPGVVNPVFSLADAAFLGYGQASDVHLIKAGAELWLYFRLDSSSGEAIVLMKTDDGGVTWSEPILVFTSVVNNSTLSPAVVEEADGGFSLYLVSDNADVDVNGGMTRYRSADGTSFSDPFPCVLPARVSPWHIDVKRVGSGYYMLVNTRPGSSTQANGLVWLVSEDGLTWVQSGVACLEKVLYGRYFYRSMFLPSLEDSTKWDLWVAEVPQDEMNQDWRVVFRNRMTMPDPWRAEELTKAVAGAYPYVVGDQFKRSDGAPGNAPTGQTWETVAGTPSITGGRLSNGGVNTHVRIQSGLANCFVEMRFDAAVDQPKQQWINLRFEGTNARYRLGTGASVIKAGQTYSAVYLDRITPGGNTTILSLTGKACMTVGDYLGARLDGTTITIYRNRQQIGQVIGETQSLTETRHGIQIADANARPDDFTVRRL